MRKSQRFKYQMLIRVRDFGKASQTVFPESSRGGQLFATVATAVAEIEAQLARRELARQEAQRVNVRMRAKVRSEMKILAAASRRVTATGLGINPVRMPTRTASAAVLNSARMFIHELEARHAAFDAVGLPSTFLGEFRSLVDEFDRAVQLQVNSRTERKGAQGGFEDALASGFQAILDLDVVVATASALDAAGHAAWAGARRIEGGDSSTPNPVPPKDDTAPTLSPAEPIGTPHTMTPAEPVAVPVTLEKAS